MKFSIQSILFGALLATLYACGGGGGGGASTPSPAPVVPNPPAQVQINQVVSTASLVSPNGAFGGVVSAQPLPGDGLASAPTLLSNQGTVQGVDGGSITFTVSTDRPLSRLMIGSTEKEGHFSIDLTSSRSIRQSDGTIYEPISGLVVLPSARQTTRSGEYQYSVVLGLPVVSNTQRESLRIVTEYIGGGRSPQVPIELRVSQIANGSEKLQFNLSWDRAVDLDIHVKGPGGLIINHDSPNGNGGILDLDSNGGCNLDGVQSENITWEQRDADPGSYVIRPSYFQACEQGDVAYTVTVNANGLQRRYFGKFTSSDADGNAGTNIDHLVGICVYPALTSENGLLFSYLVTEATLPTAAQFDPQESVREICALKAVVDNRVEAIRGLRVSQEAFGTLNPDRISVLTAPAQFSGFTGGISADRQRMLVARCIPVDAVGPNSEKYDAFWNAIFSEVFTSLITDPFADPVQIGNTMTNGGTYFVAPKGANPPHISALNVGTILGHDFYSVPEDFFISE